MASFCRRHISVTLFEGPFHLEYGYLKGIGGKQGKKRVRSGTRSPFKQCLRRELSQAIIGPVWLGGNSYGAL